MRYLFKLHDLANYVLASIIDRDHLQWFQLFYGSDSDLTFYNFEHVKSEETFDVNSLFTNVGIKLKPTKVDEVAQEKIDDTTLEVDFNIPLGTLKAIGCKLLCKDPNPNICDKKTRSILKKLSNYSWKAKAVLTVAAFVTKFGDAWLKLDNKLSESSDQLEKSRLEVTELKNLMNATLRLINIILDLKMPTCFSKRTFPALTFWIIMTIIACASQVTIITSDNQDRPYNLYPYSQIIQFILNTLTEHLEVFRVREKEEDDLRLLEFLKHPKDIVEVFKALFSAGDYMAPPIHRPTNEQVAIDELRGQKIRMLISGLDISCEDIKILSHHHEMMTTNNYDQYKIVWVPIVEQWTDELDKKFSIVQSRMPWYRLKASLTTTGMKFVKHELYYTARPVLVWISPRGILDERCVDLAEITNHYGVFSRMALDELMRNMSAFRLPELCTFFYRGKGKEWIRQFEKKAKKMVGDRIIENARITMKLQRVRESSSGGQSSNRRKRSSSHDNSVPPEVMQRLLRRQDENVWVLCEKSIRVKDGYTILEDGYGDAIIRVLGDFDQWKQHVLEKGFGDAFKEYHDTINPKP